MNILSKRFHQRKLSAPKLINPVPNPRYDDVYDKGVEQMESDMPICVLWKPNQDFIIDLIGFLKGRRVLEVFAGNGYLSSLLINEGIITKPTSILSGMDGHDIKLYCDVENIDAVSAVNFYGVDHDVLLICWPTTTPQALKAIQAWGCNRDIVYIGEVTDYSRNHLGGCATDEFFENIAVISEFNSYHGNMLEKAVVARLIE